MLKSSARRLALTGASVVVAVAVAAVTGACGARPAASAGETMILTTTTPTDSSAAPPPQVTSPSATAVPMEVPGRPLIDPNPLVQAAVGVEPNTTLGAVVYDRVTGEELLSLEPDRQFRSASLVKLLIAIVALQDGTDEKERAQITAMLSASDDDIASALWVRYGPDLVPRAAALIGLRHTEAPEVTGRWGEAKVTPHDMVRVYQYVMNNLPPEDHTLIVAALAQAPQLAADGFDQHFGIPGGLGAQWAIKQGWGNNSNAMVLHSTGLVGADWRYVVVLLTEHPLGSGWRTSANSVTAAASALKGHLPGA